MIIGIVQANFGIQNPTAPNALKNFLDDVNGYAADTQKTYLQSSTSGVTTLTCIIEGQGNEKA